MLNKERLEKRATKVTLKYGLIADQVKVVQCTAHEVYEYVGGDLAPDNARRGTCKRSTIIEVVLDAGRLMKDLKRSSHADEQFLVALDKIHGKELEDLVGPAFPYEEYEVMGQEI